MSITDTDDSNSTTPQPFPLPPIAVAQERCKAPDWSLLDSMDAAKKEGLDKLTGLAQVGGPVSRPRLPQHAHDLMSHDGAALAWH